MAEQVFGIAEDDAPILRHFLNQPEKTERPPFFDRPPTIPPNWHFVTIIDETATAKIYNAKLWFFRGNGTLQVCGDVFACALDKSQNKVKLGFSLIPCMVSGPRTIGGKTKPMCYAITPATKDGCGIICCDRQFLGADRKGVEGLYIGDGSEFSLRAHANFDSGFNWLKWQNATFVDDNLQDDPFLSHALGKEIFMIDGAVDSSYLGANADALVGIYKPPGQTIPIWQVWTSGGLMTLGGMYMSPDHGGSAIAIDTDPVPWQSYNLSTRGFINTLNGYRCFEYPTGWKTGSTFASDTFGSAMGIKCNGGIITQFIPRINGTYYIVQVKQMVINFPSDLPSNLEWGQFMVTQTGKMYVGNSATAVVEVTAPPAAGSVGTAQLAPALSMDYSGGTW